MLEFKTNTLFTSDNKQHVCICVCVCVITHIHTLLPAGCVSRHTGHTIDLWPQDYTHTVLSVRRTMSGRSPTYCMCTVNTSLLVMRGYRSNQQNTCRMTAWCHSVMSQRDVTVWCHSVMSQRDVTHLSQYLPSCPVWQAVQWKSPTAPSDSQVGLKLHNHSSD